MNVNTKTRRAKKKNKPKLVFIVGPTSSGKTAVSLELAKIMPSEIISCDSMQVYKGMDIITQVPDASILKKVNHYLVKVLALKEEYNAAKFVATSKCVIDIILLRKKTPIFVGGTGLYVKALLDGLFSSPPKNDDLRAELEKIANSDLYDQLKSIDPVSAGKININDKRRLVRAIEVYNLTGKPISEKQSEAKGIYEDFDVYIFGMELERKKLYERINNKVDEMFSKGLVDEVKKLMRRKLSRTAEKALGIKEVRDYLAEKYSVNEVKEILKKNTRRYAKRQMTWFRGDKRVVWLDANRTAKDVAEEILKRIIYG